MMYSNAKIVISCNFDPKKRCMEILTIGSTIENPISDCGFQEYLVEWDDDCCCCYIMHYANEETAWWPFGDNLNILEPTAENFEAKKRWVIQQFITEVLDGRATNGIDFFEKNFVRK